MSSEPVLSVVQRAFIGAARRAILATIAPDGRPRLVPICFSLDGEHSVLYTPIDDKPKREEDPLALARVRDIRADPHVAVLIDRWDEDWARLAWLRADGSADILESTIAAPEHAAAVAALRARYPQYERHRLDERPIIRIALERVTDWGGLEPTKP
jgi:PPOX class probable F420-dependent enzyme